MKNINWKVRLKNPQTVMAIVAGLLLLAQQIANLFGIEVEEAVGEQVLTIVETVLGILVLIGVIQDPTTQGLSDSKQALNYSKPKKEEK